MVGEVALACLAAILVSLTPLIGHWALGGDGGGGRGNYTPGEDAQTGTSRKEACYDYKP